MKGNYDLIEKIPKAELHLHIEGTLEPEMMFEIAARNKISLKYDSAEQLKEAYRFNNLQEFLDIYYEGTQVLLYERDFYELTMAYFEKAKAQNILHAEIFFDPQTHTRRGVPFVSVIDGITRAMDDAKQKYGISAKLILCFLRHLDEISAMQTLEEAMPFKDKIIAVGLDSSEVGNPPEKFARVFEAAKKAGFLTVAHAGEEGPASYVKGAVDYLHISRIDHGNRSLDDEELIRTLIEKRIPLTLCPLSNLKLQVIKHMREHPLKIMLEKGLLVTVNSDDPAYFGGYLNENYKAVYNALNLSESQIIQLAKNSFEASFLSEDEKRFFIDKVNEIAARYGLA